MLAGPGRIEIVDRVEPERAEDETLVRVASAGLCGTDGSIFAGRIPVSYPRILGHEMCGTIAAGADGFAVGARVVVDPSIACGTCYQCSRGQSNLCPTGALLGRDLDGVFAETISVPTANVYLVPDAVGDDVGPLIQVLTTCIHAHRQTTVFPGDVVVVLGLGVTGLIHVQLAKSRGAACVIGVSRSGSKLALGRELGADVVLDADGDVPAEVARASEGRGADVVIECAGKVSTFSLAVGLARVGGAVMAYGTMTETEGRVPFYDLYRKELRISNPRAAKPEDFPVAISMAASGAVRLAPLATHLFALADVVSAFEMACSGRALKVLVVL